MCECIHADRDLKFPVFAPQPIGPRENWPVYFVPSTTERGAGHYYCPRCRKGLEEARVQAGLVERTEISQLPRTGWLARLKGFLARVLAVNPSPHLPAHHGR
ncbi:hypothetical protein LUCX_260 [Xanthomonas phage vB_XciM_LucasX]|nr:hypothetical protein LUCX_260 [Xanthomonas phage vB_XciM_LucasX]